jgi:hypothetical protein
MLRQYRILPDAPGGYALLTNRGRSLWSVLEAVGSTNLITNPSFELNQNGYSGIAGTETFLRTTSRQRRGVWGMQVTPTSATTSGIRYGITLTAGQTYTWSVDALLPGGIGYVLEVVNNSNVQIAVGNQVMGAGVWRRYTLTFTPAATQNHYLRLRKNGSSSVLAFTTDGWQLEALPYATTYFDGDSRGYDADYIDANGAPRPQPYQWLGTPHASTSQRLATTRSGGRRRYLDEFGWSQPSMTGTLQVPMLISDARFANGGGMFQRAIRGVRTLALVGMIIGNPLSQAARLADLFNPENGPATLVYQRHEDDEEVYVPAVYQSGLEGDITNEYRLDTPLQFNVYDPITKGYDVTTPLNYSTNLANANYIAQRPAGQGWRTFGVGMPEEVRAMVVNSDGYLYIGGNTQGIYRWDGSNLTAIAVLPVLTDVQDMARNPAGNLYIACTNGTVYEFNTSTFAFTDLTASMNSANVVHVGVDGTLYAGGRNATQGIIRKRTTAGVWSTVLTTNAAGDTTIHGIIASAGTLYFGGKFSSVTATGTVSMSNVGSLNLTTTVPAAMGTGANDIIYDVKIAADGFLLAGGAATSIGGIASKIAAWNGVQWNGYGTAIAYNVYVITPVANGTTYIGGTGTSSGPDNVNRYRGGVWEPIDIDLPGTAQVNAITYDTAGNLTVGYNTAGTAQSAVTAINNPGTDDAHPSVTFTGPGQMYSLLNYTTGDAIYFNGLVLNAGETATLRITPGGVTFESNFRGSLMGYIGSGSNPASWNLQPGNNNISSFMSGTAAASSIYLTFRVPIGKLT